MPVYEFRCTKCGKNFDVIRPREQAGKPAKCPDDGARGQRLWTSAIVLGGEDFDMDFGDDVGAGGDFGGGDFGDDDFDL